MESTKIFKTDWKHFPLDVGKMDELDFIAEIIAIHLLLCKVTAMMIFKAIFKVSCWLFSVDACDKKPSRWLWLNCFCVRGKKKKSERMNRSDWQSLEAKFCRAGLKLNMIHFVRWINQQQNKLPYSCVDSFKAAMEALVCSLCTLMYYILHRGIFCEDLSNYRYQCHTNVHSQIGQFFHNVWKHSLHCGDNCCNITYISISWCHNKLGLCEETISST